MDRSCQLLRRVLVGLFLSVLAGCNGNLVIHEVKPKTILLVDAMPHAAFVVVHPCLTLEPFALTRLGDDQGIAGEVVQRVRARLQQDGYSVYVVPFSEKLDVAKYPYGYIVDPLHMYEPRWTPAFMQWMHELDAAFSPGAVVLLAPYSKSLGGMQGPFYSGMGAVAQINCISIPPTSGNFYANIGIHVFTFPDITRRFFTYDARSACDIALPDDVLEMIKTKTFTAEELRPYREQIARIGAAQAESELRTANVLHGAIDSCTGS